MDPYAHLRNDFAKYEHLLFKQNEYNHKFEYNENLLEEYLDCFRYLIYKNEEIFSKRSRSRCHHRPAPPDNRDPLIRNPQARPRCRAHLLMVEMEGRHTSRRVSPDGRLKLLMGVA